MAWRAASVITAGQSSRTGSGFQGQEGVGFGARRFYGRTEDVAKTLAGAWAGGRIFRPKSGRRRWYLERKTHGRQYSIALRAVRSDEDAQAALFLWNQDPAEFLARHLDKKRRDKGLVQDAVFFTPADVDALAEDQGRRELAPRYIRGCRKHAVDWLNPASPS